MNTHEQQQPREAGRGVTILVFGILSIVAVGPILGIPAWIMGRTDLDKINQGLIAESERQLTKAGMILGIIGTFYVIFVLLVVFAVLLVFGIR
ncbi:MAG: DUF4190 domain-containing protein [Ignavibacteria bacterium]|nr:DUF4190 domain-containing protein [Ignavibacteria bacterium]